MKYTHVVYVTSEGDVRVGALYENYETDMESDHLLVMDAQKTKDFGIARVSILSWHNWPDNDIYAAKKRTQSADDHCAAELRAATPEAVRIRDELVAQGKLKLTLKP